VSYTCKNPDCSAPENKKGKKYPSAMECPFCDVPLEEELSFSEEDLNLINSLPYVIAYPLKRTLSENHPGTRLNLFKDTFLNYLKYLGLLSASEFFNSNIKDKGMVALFHQNLTETAFGKWNHYIREVLKFLKQNNHEFFCPDLLTYYEYVETGSKTVKYKGEIEYIDANGDVQLKKQEATAIGMLINFRNRYLGHGLTLDGDEAERLWTKYFPIFRILLEKMNFAQAYPMLKIEDGESWLLHSAEITRIENEGVKDENIWMQNTEGKYLSILPFFIVPGELAVGNSEKAKVFTYESYTGKTIKFFSPEGTEKQTSGKILERLNLLLRDKQKETPFTPDQFTKEIFLKRIEEENKILLDTLINEKKIISGVYQHREEMEIKLREWIGARANIFFIAAEAGSGKTNLLSEIQKQYTERGCPTLIIRAGRMEKCSLNEQMAYLLNIDPSVGLQQYDSIAGRQAEPTFILIDGLNEANNAESIWQEIIDWSKTIESGSIKFVVTSRANTRADLERYNIKETDTDLLYGENKENEKSLNANAFWLTPMDMKEMKGAWESYLAKDKSRYKPLFTFDDLATFDRALYDQINNPLVLRLFLEIYNGKTLPKKGVKHLHIWQDWFNTFSTEEQTFFKLLADETWLKSKNELLLDDLLKNETLKSFISSDLVNASYTRLKNMGWISRYTKDMNACINFTVEASLLYLLGKKLQDQVPRVDLEYIKSLLSIDNTFQRSVLESFLCEQALEGDLDLVTDLIDHDSGQMDLCIPPLFYYLKIFGSEKTVKKILEKSTENDWKALLKLDDRIEALQLHDLRMNFLKLVMQVNQLKTKNEVSFCLNAIPIFDKEISLSYYNEIDVKLPFLNEDFDLLDKFGYCEYSFGNYHMSLNYYEKSLAKKIKALGGEHHSVAIAYNNIGSAWDHLGDYEKALDYYERCLAIELKALGGEHHSVAIAYNNIGSTWDHLGDYEKALDYYERCLAIELKALGGEHPSVATFYTNIGLTWNNLGEYEKALDCQEKCLAIQLKTLGWEHSEVATTYGNIGTTCHSLGNYDKALEYFEKCLAIRLKTLGEEHSNVANSYSSIGSTWNNLGIYDKALDYQEKCLAIRIKTFGGEHPSVAIAYNNIGLTWNNLGDYDKALDYQEKCLAIQIKTFGREHPSVAISYNNIGLVWKNKKNYENALDSYEKCLSIQLNTLGREHPDVATFYDNIGLTWNILGDYEKALEYFEKSLEIRLNKFGEAHPLVAISNNNIGLAWGNIGDFGKAVELYEKCLSINLKTLGSEHSDVAITYNKIGSSWYDNGDFEKAVEYYEKSLSVYLTIFGAEHPDVATLYSNIALAWDNIGNYQKVVDYYEKSLSIYLKILVVDHPDLATLYSTMGLACVNFGDYVKAIEYYEKCIAIELMILEKDHADIATLYFNIGKCYENLQDYRSAIDSYQKGFAIQIKGGYPFEIASCLEKLGDKKGAINYYIQSAEIRKDYPGLGLDATSTIESINNIQRLCKEVDHFEIEKIPEWLRLYIE
jgi:tetratricopeptide (TPR) repeat protein